MSERLAVDRRGFLGLGATLILTGRSSLRGAGPELGRGGRGVSLAGAEFGVEGADFSNQQPGVHGRDYWYNSAKSLQHFASLGFEWLRLPVRWERLQPSLLGPLRDSELSLLRRSLRQAEAAGSRLLLDLHNYARYVDAHGGRRVRVLGGAGSRALGSAELVDVWRRLSRALRDEPGLGALGLMNEPHDLPPGCWTECSQAVVRALRQDGERREILVAGDDWSSAERFPGNHPRPWIRDPLDRVRYEAHCYFDHDASGRYARPFDQELAQDPAIAQRGVRRVAPFLGWCRRHGVRGLIGEFGLPEQPGWLRLLPPFLGACDEARVPTVAWAAGEWWGSYALSLQPRADGAARTTTRRLLEARDRPR